MHMARSWMTGRRARPACAAAALMAGCALAVAQVPRAAGGAPLWELGVLSAGITQQAYPGSDEQVHRATLLPFGVYRGRWLRADGDTAGLRAVRTDTFELDIGVAGSFGAGGQGLDARRGNSKSEIDGLAVPQHLPAFQIDLDTVESEPLPRCLAPSW